MVSVMTGSSWTTIATIGIALMGIGRAQGFDDGWIQGPSSVEPISVTNLSLVRHHSLGFWQRQRSALSAHPLYGHHHIALHRDCLSGVFCGRIDV